MGLSGTDHAGGRAKSSARVRGRAGGDTESGPRGGFVEPTEETVVLEAHRDEEDNDIVEMLSTE